MGNYFTPGSVCSQNTGYGTQEYQTCTDTTLSVYQFTPCMSGVSEIHFLCQEKFMLGQCRIQTSNLLICSQLRTTTDQCVPRNFISVTVLPIGTWSASFLLIFLLYSYNCNMQVMWPKTKFHQKAKFWQLSILADVTFVIIKFLWLLCYKIIIHTP